MMIAFTQHDTYWLIFFFWLMLTAVNRNRLDKPDFDRNGKQAEYNHIKRRGGGVGVSGGSRN